MRMPSWLSPVGLLQHAAIGYVEGRALSRLRASPAAILFAVASLGVMSEYRDGDFTRANSGPANGIIDAAAFIAGALLSFVL